MRISDWSSDVCSSDLTSSKVQAQISGWYTIFNNRLASAYDPVTDRTIYRHLGRVDKYGIDGSIAYTTIPEVQLYVFGSYQKSKIKDNVLDRKTVVSGKSV